MISEQNSLAFLVDQVRKEHPGLDMLKIISAQTDDEFDSALEGILAQVIPMIESNANHLNSLGENAISAFLVSSLNMVPGLRVSQEKHSKGHVDITIETTIIPPFRRRLGEAKIYSGPGYHVKGLEQLVQRYTTGREGSGIMVEYFKDKGIKGLVDKIREHMDKEKPCAQKADTQAHPHIKWAFISYHDHACGETFRVLHINCNLYL